MEIAIVAACRNKHIVNLLLVLMVVAIWFLIRGADLPPLIRGACRTKSCRGDVCARV